jgi:hypothetical protein
MANRPDLHKFRDDLQKKPGRGQVKPPRVISAQNLDENFSKVTLIDSDKVPPAYKVKYTKDGAILTDLQGLPKDAIAKLFDVCENGQARAYWFVVWANEPELGQA